MPGLLGLLRAPCLQGQAQQQLTAVAQGWRGFAARALQGSSR